MREKRIIFVALAFSLLAHLVAASSYRHWWTAPAAAIPYPIETHLSLADLPVAAAPPAPASPSAKQPVARRAVEPRAASRPAADEPGAVAAASLPALAEHAPDTAAVEATLPPAPESGAARLPAPLAERPAPPPAPPPVVEAPAAPAVAAARARRDLPERIELKYSVQSGDQGFTVGQTTYSGHLRDGRYALVSVTEATGVAALFVGGQIIQRSEGWMTESGLQPEKFWGEKGDRKRPPVRFDWAQKRLLLPAGGVDLPPHTQDLLSFPFHLALLADENDAAWSLPVTNGKKLREYAFQVAGRETLPLGESRVDTLRLQGSRSGEGSLDVWLAPARHWLPVRIRTQDQKGKVIVLTLQAGGI